ncbi:DUF3558 domain-containing protein [Streptomyces sp. bgisy022]|uniref:DUF3558 domain-containing protein n=1 Tax=Streptomyces sp. bgisy022 TaxID=3413769 RepID=UPI003D75B28D
MQRRAYVSGAAALLAALLAGCTGGSGDGAQSDNSNPGEPGTASQAAQPGRYATLPEPCGTIGAKELEELLPGLRQLTDPAQRRKAYAGEATLTYDTDRKVGCRWKVESADATDHLMVDFERVVSYDNSVSDDSRAETLFASKRAAAQLPQPSATGSGAAGDEASEDPDADAPSSTSLPSSRSSSSADPSSSSDSSGSSGSSGSDDSSASSSSSSSPSSSPSSGGTGPSASASDADLRPRVLEDLGDEAFLDDVLSSSGSTAKERTVTVAFRTSNVIVTVQYAEQPAAVGVEPDSEEMQDRARELASRLAESLGG